SLGVSKMSQDLIGRTLNVVDAKGNKAQEKILKFVRRDNTVTTDAGNTYPAASIFNKGRGIFVEVKKVGKAAAAASTKPASTKPASTKPAAKAATISAAELEGKKISGIEVVQVSSRRGIVTLSNGQVIQLADIRRVGRGYAADVEVEEEEDDEETIDQESNGYTAVTSTDEVRGQEIAVGDAWLAVVKTFKSGNVELEDGQRINISDIYIEDETGDLMYMPEEEETEEEEDEELPEPPRRAKEKANVGGAKPKVAQIDLSAPKKLRGMKIIVDGVEDIIAASRTAKNQVVLESGAVLDVSKIKQEGSDLVYDSAVKRSALPKIGSEPKAREMKVRAVNAFDTETCADIRDIAEEGALAA